MSILSRCLSAASVLIDPFAPVYVEELGEGPAEDYALMHEAMVNPIESKQLIGSWGLNAVVPGDQSCFIITDGSTIIAAASLNLGQMGLAKWMADPSRGTWLETVPQY